MPLFRLFSVFLVSNTGKDVSKMFSSLDNKFNNLNFQLNQKELTITLHLSVFTSVHRSLRPASRKKLIWTSWDQISSSEVNALHLGIEVGHNV